MKKNLFIICAGLLLAAPAARAANPYDEGHDYTPITTDILDDEGAVRGSHSVPNMKVPENIYRAELKQAKEKELKDLQGEVHSWSDRVGRWLESELQSDDREARGNYQGVPSAQLMHKLVRGAQGPFDSSFVPVTRENAPRLCAYLEKRATSFGIPVPLVVIPVHHESRFSVLSVPSKHSIVLIDSDNFEAFGGKHLEMYLDYLMIGVKNSRTNKKSWLETATRYVPLAIGLLAGLKGLGTSKKRGTAYGVGAFGLTQALMYVLSGMAQRRMLKNDVTDVINHDPSRARDLLHFLEHVGKATDVLLGDAEGYIPIKDAVVGDHPLRKVQTYLYDRAYQARSGLAKGVNALGGNWHPESTPMIEERSREEGWVSTYPRPGLDGIRTARDAGVAIDNHLVEDWARGSDGSYQVKDFGEIMNEIVTKAEAEHAAEDVVGE